MIPKYRLTKLAVRFVVLSWQYCGNGVCVCTYTVYQCLGSCNLNMANIPSPRFVCVGHVFSHVCIYPVPWTFIYCRRGRGGYASASIAVGVAIYVDFSLEKLNFFVSLRSDL